MSQSTEEQEPAVSPKPDQAAELDLANDHIPREGVPSPLAAPTHLAHQEQPPAEQLILPELPGPNDVVQDERHVERQGFTLIMRFWNLLHLGSTFCEEGYQTSWLGPLVGVVTLSLGAAYLGGRVLLTSTAPDALRIQAAAGFGGAVLVLCLVFLVFRSRRKP
jgi:hypothetical protein